MPTTFGHSLHGILPPMTTPFDERGAVVESAIREQVEFLLEAGAHGIVAGGSTGEGHTFSREDFVQVMEATASAVDGRAPLLGGLIVNSTREAVARAQLVRHLAIDALQVTPVHYLFRPDDDATLAHFRTVAEETGRPVIIYNVIPWNYLPPALLHRILAEVPGVIGVKQSAGDLKLLSDLLLDLPDGKLVFAAMDALLYSAFALGAQGAISALLAAAPRASLRLWQLVQAGDHTAARDLHWRLSRLWNAMAHDNLPACVKYAQGRQGCPGHQVRAPMSPPDESQQAAIAEALDAL